MPANNICAAFIAPEILDRKFVECYLETLCTHWGGRITRRLSMVASGRIASARNTIVEQFLERTECDWLWMVDADMVWTPEQLIELADFADADERPMVGGLCFAGNSTKSNPTLYLMIDGWPSLILTYPRGKAVPVDATGAAFLLVHRRVLEAVGDRWREHTTFPWFAETELRGPENKLQEFGEDITFCLRVRQLGFPIWVHNGIEIGHRKHFVLGEADYDRMGGPYQDRFADQLDSVNAAGEREAIPVPPKLDRPLNRAERRRLEREGAQ